MFEVLNKYVKLIEQTNVSFSFQGNDYFNKIANWIEGLDLGNQVPRNSLQTKNDLINFVLENPVLTQYQENERFKNIFKRLTILQQEKSKNMNEEIN